MRPSHGRVVVEQGLLALILAIAACAESKTGSPRCPAEPLTAAPCEAAADPWNSTACAYTITPGDLTCRCLPAADGGATAWVCAPGRAEEARVTAAFSPITVRRGQLLEVRTKTIGPGRYTTPEIAGGVVRFVEEPPVPAELRTPGGPVQLFVFEAVATGWATITLPHTGELAPEVVTVAVAER